MDCAYPRISEAPHGGWACSACIPPIIVIHTVTWQPQPVAPSLPSSYPVLWHNRDSVIAALSALYPLYAGLWDPAHVTKLYNRLPGNSNFLQKDSLLPEMVATPASDYWSLGTLISFSPEHTVFDPWFGSGSSNHFLRDMGVRKVLGSDASPRLDTHAFCGDGLLALTYTRARRHFGGSLDLIVTSPWWALLDLAVPMAYCQADLAAFIHVPYYYSTQGPPARLSWLTDLARRELAYQVLCEDRGNTGFRSAWLLLFRSIEARDALLPSFPRCSQLPTFLGQLPRQQAL
jgi:hypothetical protein